MAVPSPEKFDVHPVYGFAPEHPLTQLPSYFAEWMAIAFNTKEYIKDGSLRQRVKKVPLLDHACLGDDVRAWRLAHLVLTAIVHGYVWCEGPENIPHKLPSQMAIPYKGVADFLGIVPNMAYYTLILCNWKLKEGKDELTIDNLETILTLNGGRNEGWFYLTTMGIEFAAASGIMAVLEAQRNVISNNASQLAMNLQKIETSICNMTQLMPRFADGCDPDIMARDSVPFFQSWDHEAFKKQNLRGLVYEGVSEEPMAFYVASAAQTPVFPVFDVALGINPYPPTDKRLQRSLDMISPKHKQFIAAIAAGPSIKDYVQLSNHPQCKETLDRCVQAVGDFRSSHIKGVTSYAVQPSTKFAKASGSPDVVQETAKNNKELITFLKDMRDSRDRGASQSSGGRGITWFQRVMTSPWTTRFLLGTLAALLFNYYRNNF